MAKRVVVIKPDIGPTVKPPRTSLSNRTGATVLASASAPLRPDGESTQVLPASSGDRQGPAVR
jgi:hypothetical protein